LRSFPAPRKIEWSGEADSAARRVAPVDGSPGSQPSFPRRLGMRSAAIVGAGLVVLASTAAALAADTPKDPHHAPVKSAALEPFKALEGKWVGKMSHGGQPIDAVVTYKVTSNGSAVVETLGPGTPHEMVSVIHPDGDALVLTHYCALGNQPRMKTSGKPEPHKVHFSFVDATNLKSSNDMHMHDVVFTFVDKDTLKTEWTNYVDGKPNDKAVFEVKRAK
jgi:hypothetical protein